MAVRLFSLTNLELVGVATVCVQGIGVYPLSADLEQLPHQVAHLGTLAEEGAVRVGRRRDARAVDLEERMEEDERKKFMIFFMNTMKSGFFVREVFVSSRNLNFWSQIQALGHLSTLTTTC